MSQTLLKQPNDDPTWDAIRQAADALARQEPILGRLAHVGVLNQAGFEDALSYILAQHLGNEEAPAILLRQLFNALLAADARIGIAARADLDAVCKRDPACNSPLEVLLFRKGFHALQTYRLAHAFFHEGRRALALLLQSRMNLVFGIDINPAAQLGSGIMIDHGTGVVIGETAVVEDGVSMLQGVTLGGTGKDVGDRHAKIREGVMISAGAGIFGNIEVGAQFKDWSGQRRTESGPCPMHCSGSSSAPRRPLRRQETGSRNGSKSRRRLEPAACPINSRQRSLCPDFSRNKQCFNRGQEAFDGPFQSEGA